jgi:hypothetical protein
MALTKGALFSLEASGQFGKSIVFDRRGRARQYTIPANPKSGGQGDARQILAAVQAALKIAGPTTIAAMKSVAPTGYLWNSNMVKQAVGTGAANYDDAHTAFGLLSGGQQTAWNNAFTAVNVPDIDYSTMPTPSAGEAAFIVCSALFASGAVTSPGTPSGTNEGTWHTALVS